MNNIIINIFRPNFLWVFILILGVLTFSVPSFDVPSDMAWYMNLGMNISMGKGFVDTDGTPVTSRGPLFPLMIALSFLLFGISVESAFMPVRIFAVLNALLLYFIGEKFYNKKVGFAAALLVLTSYSINFWSFRHLDAVWPFFVLFSIFSIYLYSENKSYLWSLLSGAALALAILTKEASLVFIPLPLLALVFIKALRNKKGFYGVLYLYAALISVLFIFIISSYFLFGNIGWISLKNSIIPKAVNLAPIVSGEGMFAVLSSYSKGVFLYFYSHNHSNALNHNFSVFPLFIIACIFTLFRALKGNKADILLLISLVLFTPILYRVGMMNFRVGQTILFLLLVYLATANLLWISVVYVTRKCAVFLKGAAINSVKVVNLSFIFIILLIVSIQFFCGSSRNIYFFGRAFMDSSFVKNIAAAFNINVPNRSKGIYYGGEGFPGVISWVNRSIPVGSRIISDELYLARALYFWTKGQYPVYTMNFKESRDRDSLSTPGDKVIFLSARLNQCDPRNRFYALEESDFLSSIAKNNISYVFISLPGPGIISYFDDNRGFDKIAQFNRPGINVFKTNKPAARKDFKTVISTQAHILLDCLMNKN